MYSLLTHEISKVIKKICHLQLDYSLKSYIRLICFTAVFLTTPALSEAIKQDSQKTVDELSALLDDYQDKLTLSRTTFNTLKNRLKSYKIKQADAEQQLQQYAQDLKAFEESQANEQNQEQKLNFFINNNRKKVTNLGYQLKFSRLQKILNKTKKLQIEAGQINDSIELMSSQINQLTNKISNINYQNSIIKPEVEPEPKIVEITTPVEQPIDSEPKAVLMGKSGSILYAKAKVVEPELGPEPGLEVSITEDKPIKALPQVQPPKKESRLTHEKKRTPKQKQARREVEKLFEKTKNADKTQSKNSLALTLKIGNKKSVELEYLGNEQYYTEESIKQGKYVLIIKNHKFNLKVPTKENNDTFVIMYDANTSKLAAFNKKLLD